MRIISSVVVLVALLVETNADIGAQEPPFYQGQSIKIVVEKMINQPPGVIARVKKVLGQ